MKERIIFNADKTANPKLWVYWGGSQATDTIVANRNRFEIEYELDKVQPKSRPRKIAIGGRNFDHVEYYKTRNGKWVILNSPYSNNEEQDIKLACLGFKKIYPLYHQYAVTYVRVIDDARSHRWDYDQAKLAYEAMKALKAEFKLAVRDNLHSQTDLPTDVITEIEKFC